MAGVNGEPADPVIVERRDGWVSVTLSRPHRKNAMTGPMLDALADAVDRASADESVAAVVLAGADGAFCSGVDLTELQADPPHPWAATFGRSVQRAHLALYRCACPIVVALERYAINGGSALALAGDLIVAGDDAFVQIGEIRQGTVAPMNAAWLLLKSDESTLSRLALVGDRVPATRLHDLGVIHEIVPPGDVVDTAFAHAARLASYAPGASRATKAEIRSRTAVDPETWFRRSADGGLLGARQIRT